MSSGKKHESINNIFLIIGTLVALFFFGIENTRLMGLTVLGFVIGTFWMNPDLDIRSRPYNRWGIFKFIWKPYQMFGHRSVWTHGYIISDIIRFLYLGTFVILVALLISFTGWFSIGSLITNVYTFIQTYPYEFLAFFFGNVLSSSLHTFTDQTSTGLKKMRRAFGGKRG